MKNAEQIDETLGKWKFRYKLYVLLKAIYTYYTEEVNGKFAEKIYEMLTNRKLLNCKEHPIELIYRYMGLILYEYNKKRDVSPVDEYVKDAFVNAVTCMEPAQIDMKQDLTIIMCISYHSMWKFNCMTGQESRNEELIELLQEHCRRSGWEELLKNYSRCRIWIRYLNMSIADKKRKNANEYEMVFHSVFGGIFLFVQLYVVRGMSKTVK